MPSPGWQDVKFLADSLESGHDEVRLRHLKLNNVGMSDFLAARLAQALKHNEALPSPADRNDPPSAHFPSKLAQEFPADVQMTTPEMGAAMVETAELS